ncbi:hypothetical protein An12g08450 [Aspergillus niger]|uniref:Uncharacterized protein n=2 Tax=Aspergillus niger TaxID=5061 RepID=A2R0F7_ASPNC|nr:hypothetical protein An12g08450 [Aspergillus niger]CAK41295.1 hypothetical protein An12g08450 [Aspergillus niger]
MSQWPKWCSFFFFLRGKRFQTGESDRQADTDAPTGHMGTARELVSSPSWTWLATTIRCGGRVITALIRNKSKHLQPNHTEIARPIVNVDEGSSSMTSVVEQDCRNCTVANGAEDWCCDPDAEALVSGRWATGPPIIVALLVILLVMSTTGRPDSRRSYAGSVDHVIQVILFPHSESTTYDGYY